MPRILLVDDEPALQRSLGRALERAGHEVLVAGDADSAYAVLLDHRVDLVLMDLGLPQLRGDTLALALLCRWPELHGRIVLMSGDLEAVRPDWPPELRACPTLAKPFGLDTLDAAVAAALQPPLRRSSGHA